MSTDETLDVAGLREVLAAHEWRHSRDTHCICGFRVPLAQLALDGYYAHLEAAVLAWIEERLTGAREGVWTAIVDVREASPRLPDDADSEDLATAALNVVHAALTTTEEIQ